jgi:hypothetical protein
MADCETPLIDENAEVVPSNDANRITVAIFFEICLNAK